MEFEPTPFHLGALALKELFIGIVIGVITRLAFTVFEITGGLVNVASLSFPRANEQDGLNGSPLQTFYPLLGTTIFLLVGGHHAWLSGIAGTLRCMPPATLPPIDAFGDTASQAVLRLFTSAIAAAVLISAPIFIAGLAAETITGIMLRITGGTTQAGTQLARVFAVYLIAIATLGLVLENGIDFLSNSLNGDSICKQLSP
jgi:flagellar biosynthesis protein FliR